MFLVVSKWYRLGGGRTPEGHGVEGKYMIGKNWDRGLENEMTGFWL